MLTGAPGAKASPASRERTSSATCATSPRTRIGLVRFASSGGAERLERVAAIKLDGCVVLCEERRDAAMDSRLERRILDRRPLGGVVRQIEHDVARVQQRIAARHVGFSIAAQGEL